MQDGNAEEDVPGAGNGYVNAFDTSGNFIRRVASGRDLNSPFGLALAPQGFGSFSGYLLLVGNTGDGTIHAFDPTRLTGNGEFKSAGVLHSTSGKPLEIGGLRSIQFGQGNSANGVGTTVYITAGSVIGAGTSINLLGSIGSTPTPSPAPTP